MSRRAIVILVAGCALLALVVNAGTLAHLGQTDAYGDWDQHLFYADVATRAVLHDHQLPLWNPFPCGGIPLLAHPESRVLTPFFALHLLLGAARAIPIEIVLHSLIAALGMALLARSVKASVAGALVAATIFAGSSFVPLHLGVGHLWVLPVAWAPLCLWLDARAGERPILAAAAGVVLALMIGEGGIYIAPHVGLLLCAATAWRAIRARSPRPVAGLLITFATAFLLAAPKLIPLLDLLSHRPRHVDSHEWISLVDLWKSLTARGQNLGVPNSEHFPWAWHEIGHYVGLPALALAAIGALRDRRRSLAWLAMLVVFTMLALGDFAPWSPWALLHRLPLLGSQHVPTRFLALAVLAIALLAARGATSLLERAPPRARSIAGAALVLLVGIDVVSASAGLIGAPRCPLRPWPDDAPRSTTLLTLRRAPGGAYCRPSPRSAMARAPSAGVALLDATEQMCPRTGGGYLGRDPGIVGADEAGYRGEAWIAEGEGRVMITHRTQNSIALTVETRGPARVVLAQNADAGWRVRGGRLVDDSDGRLALVVDGPGAVDLSYVPPHALAALAGPLVAVLGIAWLWRRDRRRRARIPI